MNTSLSADCSLHLDLCARLDGRLILSDTLPSDRELLRAAGLYKFIWVREGSMLVEIDRIPVRLEAGDAVTLSPLQRLAFAAGEGSCRSLLFNSNFYCIFGHDDEVSCNGFLFNGSSHVMRLHIAAAEAGLLDRLVEEFAAEFGVEDGFREEMLRIQLKRFIVFFTRIARRRFDVTHEKEPGFEIVRQFHVLVDSRFREKKQVADYASMLCRSPKTLTNLFSLYGMPSPLKIIHERLLSEARRLLLFSSLSAKEVASELGFDDPASFSRFFRQAGGESVTEFRMRMVGKN